MKIDETQYISICDGRYCKLRSRCKRHMYYMNNPRNVKCILLVINPNDIDLDGKCNKFWDNF